MRLYLPFAAIFFGFFETLCAQTPARQSAIARLALRGDPRHLDPQIAYDSDSLPIVQAIYDTLLEYHPLKSDPYTLRPCMLVGMPKREVSANGRDSYACELKRGIRFHDDACFPEGKGREVSAADVHYAFQRLCDPGVDSLFFESLADVVEGMTEARAQAEKSGEPFDYNKVRVSGVEVLDTQRFRIHLRRPYPQIVYWLAMSCTTPVPREAAEFYRWNVLELDRPQKWQMHPVGTGAFELREFVSGKRIRLARSLGYAASTFPSDGFPQPDAPSAKKFAGNRLPLVDEVELSIFRDNQPINAAFLKGELDSIGVNKDAQQEFFEANGSVRAELRDRGVFTVTVPDASTFWITFNLDDPTIGKNKKLRQAIACAFDSQAYTERFFNGIPKVATQLVPLGIFGHDPDRINPLAYNVAKAKQLLKEAGYPGGKGAEGKSLEISFLTQSVPWAEAEKGFIADALQAIGLRARIESADFKTVLDRRDRGKFQVSIGTGWGADYPDPENFFSIFHSRHVPPKGVNTARYRSAEFDRLCDQMSAMDDTPERLDLIRKLNALLTEDCPVAFTHHKDHQVMLQPGARRATHAEPFNAGWKFLIPRL